MRQIYTVLLFVILITGITTLFFTYNQANYEELSLENDIQRRSALISDSLKETAEPNFINKSDKYLQTLVERFTENQRLAGIAIVDNKGKIIAASVGLPTADPDFQKIGTDVMDGDKPDGGFINFKIGKMYVFATPLHEKKSVVGSLIIVQHADYIDTRVSDIWKNNLIRLVLQSLIISIVILLILRWIVFEPLRNLVNSLRSTRMGSVKNKAPRVLNYPIFGPLLQELGNVQQNLIAARIAASEEARLRLKKIDSPWTAERLSAFVQTMLKDRTIYVVSNREPYIHSKNGNKISFHMPASGVVTAIEPIMQACGGMWIAQGSGDADKLVVDKDDKVGVPPNDPRYTLKRVWLSDEEQKGFYDGFSNEGIWPLCHMAHTRPIFRKTDWEQYVEVNRKFAKSVLSEIKSRKNPIIIIQDFHFALLPRLIKNKRPDATIALFWHIPWPNAESFSICPWKKEILDGLLGADILGFQTQLHCNNFMTTVGKELEALIDLEQFSVSKNSHNTYVKHFPISIAFTKNSPHKEEKSEEEGRAFLEKIGIRTRFVGIGVDRLDYTKGVLERLKGIELFLAKYPKYIGDFTFVQISAPSRSTIENYKDFGDKVQEEIDRINNNFKHNNWKPIVYLKKYHSHDQIYPLYKAADFCLVTPLHDGMNLVAKEFVSSRDDEKGVLILSQFTGASRELRDALIINPYNGEQTADAIYNALNMSKTEQARRMRRMRDIVKGYNVYRWSAELLRTMIDLG